MGRILEAGQIEHPRQRSSIVATLRAIFSRKRSTERIRSKDNKESNIAEENQNKSNNVVPPSYPSPKRDKTNDENNSQDDDYLNQPLPPPPTSAYHFSRSYSMALSRANSGGGKKLRSSLSMRLSLRSRSQNSSLSTIDKKEKKMERDNSLWKKTIILGDKCKVPDVDEDEDTVMYDEKGNIISAYHKRTPGSRQTSFIDLDAVHGATTKT